MEYINHYPVWMLGVGIVACIVIAWGIIVAIATAINGY